MMLVTTVAPGPHSEGCLFAGARREIDPSSPEWSTPTGRELIAKGIKVETDMLIHDKRALVHLSLEESAFVPKERIVHSRMVLVEKCDDDGNRFVKARLTARGDQDPELLSLVRNQQTSAPTVSTNGKVVTLQVIASLGADVELGDVNRAFLESAELNRQGGKLFLRQPSGGLQVFTINNSWKYVYHCMVWMTVRRGGSWWFPISFGTLAGNLPLWMNVSLFSLIWNPRVLTGILCVHVDDLLLGGCGAAYRQTINAPRSRFPFRKWKRNQGEFCGSHVSHDVLTKEINVSQSTYALKINNVTVRARAQPEDKATPAEIAGSCCTGELVTASSKWSSGPTLSSSQRHGAPSETTPWVDVAFSSNIIGKLAVGDAFRCGFSERSRESVTSWLHHFGDWWSFGKRRIDTLESVD